MTILEQSFYHSLFIVINDFWIFPIAHLRLHHFNRWYKIPSKYCNLGIVITFLSIHDFLLDIILWIIVIIIICLIVANSDWLLNKAFIGCMRRLSLNIEDQWQFWRRLIGSIDIDCALVKKAPIRAKVNLLIGTNLCTSTGHFFDLGFLLKKLARAFCQHLIPVINKCRLGCVTANHECTLRLNLVLLFPRGRVPCLNLSPICVGSLQCILIFISRLH